MIRNCIAWSAGRTEPVQRELYGDLRRNGGDSVVMEFTTWQRKKTGWTEAEEEPRMHQLQQQQQVQVHRRARQHQQQQQQVDQFSHLRHTVTVKEEAKGTRARKGTREEVRKGVRKEGRKERRARKEERGQARARRAKAIMKMRKDAARRRRAARTRRHMRPTLASLPLET